MKVLISTICVAAKRGPRGRTSSATLRPALRPKGLHAAAELSRATLLNARSAPLRFRAAINSQRCISLKATRRTEPRFRFICSFISHESAPLGCRATTPLPCLGAFCKSPLNKRTFRRSHSMSRAAPASGGGEACLAAMGRVRIDTAAR